MPTFTFTKSNDYAEGMGDTNITMTFVTDDLEILRTNFEDFVNGAGFVTKPEAPSLSITEEDFMWDDALTSKFGADVISIDNFNLGGK